MNLKYKFVAGIFCVIILVLYLFTLNSEDTSFNVQKVYNVYLDGKRIGAISDEEALYNLINENQQTIKDKYNVTSVYPPNSLEIIANYAYNPDIMDLNSIYNKIEEIQDFTVLGYEITIGANESHDEYTIYTLDKNIFKQAVEKFILAFIDEDGYNNYINGNQKLTEEEGIIYQDLTILEDIVIKKKLISVNENIYEDSDVLAQDLLFGFNHEEKSYTVKLKDTIESISEENKLNTQEFLIANPNYSSKDSLLAVGEVVNVTLIEPVMSFSYLVDEVLEVETPFENTIQRDNTKSSNYEEIVTGGVTGLSLQEKKYTVVNGETNSDVEIKIIKTIREKVDQVTIKGRQVSSIIWGSEYEKDTGSGWKWPTSSPYAITSNFGYRNGSLHRGVDISGTGFGSNIYAANDGVVIKVHTGCANVGSYPKNTCGGGYGNYVVISHDNGLYTTYAHLTKDIKVYVGQTVQRGEVIGYMGSSGNSTGTHLHFGYSTGTADNFKNPLVLYQ